MSSYQSERNAPSGPTEGGRLAVPWANPDLAHTIRAFCEGSSVIGAELLARFRQRHGDGSAPARWIVDEPEIHLGDDVLVPDVAGWRHDTLPAYPADAAFFTTPPDWTCEILSVSMRCHDVTRKRDIYAREGVGHLWFVDPDARTLEAFELRDGA